MKSIYGILCLLFIINTSDILAAPASNAGPAVFGVQLTISITNTTIPYGVLNTLSCVVTNSSTNRVALDDPLVPKEDTDVWLVSASGEKYMLTSRPVAGREVNSFLLSTNETRTWTLPIQLDQSVPTGEYSLHAERWFVIPTNETRNAGGSLKCDLPSIRVEKPENSSSKREPER